MKSKLLKSRLLHLLRLEWACRRGMLECDLCLAPLVKQQFAPLSPAQQDDLYHLLELPDTLLCEWFMNKANPTGEYAHFQSLIDIIRAQCQ